MASIHFEALRRKILGGSGYVVADPSFPDSFKFFKDVSLDRLQSILGDPLDRTITPSGAELLYRLEQGGVCVNGTIKPEADGSQTLVGGYAIYIPGESTRHGEK